MIVNILKPKLISDKFNMCNILPFLPISYRPCWALSFRVYTYYPTFCFASFPVKQVINHFGNFFYRSAIFFKETLTVNFSLNTRTTVYLKYDDHRN